MGRSKKVLLLCLVVITLSAFGLFVRNIGRIVARQEAHRYIAAASEIYESIGYFAGLNDGLAVADDSGCSCNCPKCSANFETRRIRKNAFSSQSLQKIYAGNSDCILK